MGFSFQYQTLVVEGDRRWFSWQFPRAGCGGCGGGSFHGSLRCWLCGGCGVFKAGPEAGCEGERPGFSWQSHTLIFWGEVGFHMTVLDAGFLGGGEVGGRVGGSNGSLRRWLSGERI